MAISAIKSRKEEIGKKLSLKGSIEEIKGNLIGLIDEFDGELSEYSDRLNIDTQLFEEALTRGDRESNSILSERLAFYTSKENHSKLPRPKAPYDIHYLLSAFLKNSNQVTALDAKSISKYLGYIFDRSEVSDRFEQTVVDVKEAFQELFENEVALKSLSGNEKSKAR